MVGIDDEGPSLFVESKRFRDRGEATPSKPRASRSKPRASQLSNSRRALHRALRRWALAAIGLAVLLAVIVKTPSWLAQHWARGFDQLSATEQTSRLLHLHSLGDVATGYVVERLASPHPEVADLAAQLLANDLERWKALPVDAAANRHARLIRRIAAIAGPMQPRQNARILPLLRTCRDDIGTRLPESYHGWCRHVDTLIANMNAVPATESPSVATAGEVVAGTGGVVAENRPTLRIKSATRIVDVSDESTTRASAQPMRPPAGTPAILAVLDSRTGGSVSRRTTVVGRPPTRISPKPSAAPFSEPENKAARLSESTNKAARLSESMNSVARLSESGNKVARLSESMTNGSESRATLKDDSESRATLNRIPKTEREPLSLRPVDPPMHAELLPRWDSAQSVSAGNVSPATVSPANVLQAMPERSLHHLLRDARVSFREAAELELMRRGYQAIHLQIAKISVSPDRRDRLDLVEQLPKLDRMDPRPWLTMMLSDDDRDVRLKVLAMIATMNDPEGFAVMRLRMTREDDPVVLARIRRYLNMR
ncbi:MAG: HEAT repeat domain-containing protein [Planctomycetota bacterium]